MLRKLAIRSVLGLTSLGLLASPARADNGRVFVVTAGGDSNLYVPEEGAERSALGYFGRLSWETPVPDYTTKDRGYRWNLGIDPDVEFSRAWRDGSGRLTVLEAGLRLSVPFSQKRMGLLQVSARGGFWFALRGGVTSWQDGDVGPSAEGRSYLLPQGSSPMRPEAGGMLLDLAVGEFILLGSSGLRLELEFSSLLAESPEVFGDAEVGLRVRAGLGASF